MRLRVWNAHNQGGTGGGGDATHNAVSIGIERLTVTGGRVTADNVANLISKFHPGFVAADGSMVNTLALAHHGGSDRFERMRAQLRSNVSASFSESGGPVSPDEVRFAGAYPIEFRVSEGGRTIEIRAKMFQRNTTALFGSGLIDQVEDREIKAQQRIQMRHPEISGRPSTLPDGRIGKFGWRANVATLLDFNDQACANELGLQTRRKLQPTDPTASRRPHSNHDVSDRQIKAINHFVAMLPSPAFEIPNETRARLEAQRGKRLFASVGCAVCHVQDMGPAKGIF